MWAAVPLVAHCVGPPCCLRCPIPYRVLEGFAGLREDTVNQLDAVWRGQKGTVFGVGAEVAHEGVEAGVGDPQVQGADKPGNLVARVANNLHLGCTHGSNVKALPPVDSDVPFSDPRLDRQGSREQEAYALGGKNRALFVAQCGREVRQWVARAQKKGNDSRANGELCPVDKVFDKETRDDRADDEEPHECAGGDECNGRVIPGDHDRIVGVSGW